MGVGLVTRLSLPPQALHLTALRVDCHSKCLADALVDTTSNTHTHTCTHLPVICQVQAGVTEGFFFFFSYNGPVTVLGLIVLRPKLTAGGLNGEVRKVGGEARIQTVEMADEGGGQTTTTTLQGSQSNTSTNFFFFFFS